MLHDHGIQVNGSFVLGFDHDRPDVFAQTAEWVEANRLECATFHILTPYPRTPLFRRWRPKDGCSHRDWSRYDTAHAVFRPRHMSPRSLDQGYAWTYRRLFSHASIWRRRPEDWRAIRPTWRCRTSTSVRTVFWHLLIQQDLVPWCWRPLVELTRRRHVSYRRRLARQPGVDATPGQLVSAGV
jgi:radical SAM superfamily enzyme YgiQ (UPF0313 family)